MRSSRAPERQASAGGAGRGRTYEATLRRARRWFREPALHSRGACGQAAEVPVAGRVRSPAARGGCGFPSIVLLQNNESGKIFSNGTFAVSGVLKARLTNSNTGKSVDLNISGGGTIVPRSDGTALLTSHGPALVFFLPGQLGPGSSGALLFVHGRFMEVLDQNGNPVPGTFTSTGSVEDLCPTLG